jgi:hypothetical protein
MFKKIIISLIIITTSKLFAQETITSTTTTTTTTKSVVTKGIEDSKYNNTIRYNITNPMIFGTSNIIIGYERVLSNNQTFSIDFGRNKLPNLKPRIYEYKEATLELKHGRKNNGLHITADYRFYLKSENKYRAPRGVYIGPYYSFNSFNHDNNWNLETNTFNGDLSNELSLQIHTVGVQLGYQFVIAKRFAIDVIAVGPGIGNYKFKATLSSSLSAADESILYEQINQLITNRIPGYNIVFENNNLKKNGIANINTLGYRFMINLGYRF